ncbi:MAG: hypothetical protein RH859_08310 [Longimicrobiales bacterium]
MPRRSMRDVGEAVALLGVVASLVFVGLELRQARIAAQAAAYQELGVAIAENWMDRASDRALNDLVLIAAEGDSAAWAELDASDVYVLRSYALANIRLYETAYLQVEQKLLDVDALERLGWANFLESRFLERMWPHTRPMVSPDFAAYLVAQRPGLGPL